MREASLQRISGVSINRTASGEGQQEGKTDELPPKTPEPPPKSTEPGR
jgi:hypothetical protein